MECNGLIFKVGFRIFYGVFGFFLEFKNAMFRVLIIKDMLSDFSIMYQSFLFPEFWSGIQTLLI